MMEKKQDMVMMTQEQFTALITQVLEANESRNRHFKSFAACTKHYDGERNFDKVEEFLTGISVYKKIEKISDEDALEGLTLLLSGAAATWWNGVKGDIKKWTQALDAIKSAFAPKMQPHEVYLKLYSKKQTTEKIDAFVCEKRALLAQLPAKRHKEEEHLDFVYGLLNITYKKEIARSEVKTFAELLDRGRHIESLLKEAGEETTSTQSEQKPLERCSFCGKKGHIFDVCRKRLAEPKETVVSQTEKTPVITCYGCGAPGVYRSNCSTCKTKETPPKPVAFYAVQSSLKVQAKIPTIKVNINGEEGYAYIDTAACRSIASMQLYKTLLRKGTQFDQLVTDIKLADGTVKTSNLLITTTDIRIGERTLPITLSVIPEAADNRTLLGVEFLEQAGIILNAPARSWNFIDEPQTIYNFIQLNSDAIPMKAMKRMTFEVKKEPVETNTTLLYSVDLHLNSDEGTTLTKNEQKMFNEPLIEHSDIFEKNTEPTPFTQHRIDTGNHPLISVKPYGLSPTRQKQLREKLDDTINVDVIEECDSPWSAPVILVPKGETAFIQNFAEIARPLTNLTKKKISWKWEKEQQDTFLKLKNALTTSPILKQASDDLPFAIKTDASQYAIGAALVQGEGENEHPVEYASRLLTQAGRNYSVTKKETLAIVWAISRFRGYIEGSQFTAPRQDGPYIILNKHGTFTYEIAHSKTPDKPIGKYHTSAITKFEKRDNVTPKPTYPMRRRGRPRKRIGAGTQSGRP